ncbi:flagella basal body P-ring formation protein FlgA [Meinhardsimonia xiamenensis]|jgi:flagella basal body P-ring formation protein FlgA|uniref:Flagella basal body P-ring formation protein FlgA n=1 Tax=Meinhardsimonia xiamenensis TaxID=990712 RepID=A0A1G9E9T6_9RHOB|nr:flagellar basal body P-ring formation chaperone FlgA [Meinhardsimonia xiamenensis]PRX33867.1 flagella basal body P-ring formation protein FlgA [Meinhardsimonia xiamenensis]SDK72887.1 flagella basal body P-ring formation protein FlgA [Meinhardsimonia xiamenensis]
MARIVCMVLICLAGPALAEALVAARTIRAQEVITAADLSVTPAAIPGALSSPEEAIGLEARVALYAGRPIRPEDLGPPAVIERNAIVTLVYRKGRLTITAEARALGRAGVGDVLRVMNLASRNTVVGRVREDGSVLVGEARAVQPERRASR